MSPPHGPAFHVLIGAPAAEQYAGAGQLGIRDAALSAAAEPPTYSCDYLVASLPGAGERRKLHTGAAYPATPPPSGHKWLDAVGPGSVRQRLNAAALYVTWHISHYQTHLKSDEPAR